MRISKANLPNISRFHHIPGSGTNGPYFLKIFLISLGFAYDFAFCQNNGLSRIIVSASRSPPGLDSKGSTFGAHFRLAPKRVDFWRSFSHSGLFLEPFLAHVWFIFRLFSLIFRSWAHFGSAGGQLFHHKNGLDHQRRPNRHFPQNILILWVPFWSHVSSIFRFLGLCF